MEEGGSEWTPATRCRRIYERRGQGICRSDRLDRLDRGNRGESLACKSDLDKTRAESDRGKE